MSSVEDCYYKINRILLKAIGLWPYQTSIWASFHAITMALVFLSGVLFQLAVFLTHECTMDVILNVLSFVFPSIFAFLLHCIFYYNLDVFKEVTENIYYHWKSFKNKAELSILDEYASISKMFTQIFTCLTMVAIIVPTIGYAIPMTLDVILPLNESRSPDLYVKVEYFVDPDKYYSLLVVYTSLFCFLGMISATATSTMLLGYVIHVCAMFKVANYRMEAIMNKSILRISSPERDHVIYERIIHAVEVHRRTLQFVYEVFPKSFCKLLFSSFDVAFFMAIVIGVVSLSINMFRFLQVLNEFDELVQIFIPFVLIIVHFCYLFFGNHVGQQVTDGNADIFNTVYNLPWYIAPINIQKVLLFLLLNGNKNFYITISGLFTISYECFTKLVTTSMSYFTVIHSFQ